MRKHPLFWLPNLLTIARCFMAVGVAWLIFMIAEKETSLISLVQSASVDAQTRAVHQDMISDYRTFWGGMALLLFLASAITDFLDGFLARLWNVESRFGRLLDPIADKLAVGFPLLVIAGISNWALPIALPVFAIIFRDLLITFLRFAGLGAGRMAVKFIAKLKTFLEMVLIVVFLSLLAFIKSGNANLSHYLTLWTICLWGVAAVSVYTGTIYLVGLFGKPKHQPPEPEPMMIED